MTYVVLVSANGHPARSIVALAITLAGVSTSMASGERYCVDPSLHHHTRQVLMTTSYADHSASIV